MVEASIRRALDVAAEAAHLDHDGLRGRAREIFVNDMLTPLLYPTMGTCTGVVIDSEGRQSGQTDVIVFDRRIVPPLLVSASEGMIPAESVLFTIEVKSRLDYGELVKSVKWGCSMKALAFDPEMAPRLPPEIQALVLRAKPVLGSGLRPRTIPAAVYAFDSDLAPSRTIDDEVERMKPAIEEVNGERIAAGSKPIRVPLSAITVASRGHADCVDAEARPPLWRTFPHNAVPTRTEATLRFLTWLNRWALRITAERSAISLERYLQDDDE